MNDKTKSSEKLSSADINEMDRCCINYGKELHELSNVSMSRIVEITEKVGEFLCKRDVKVNQFRRFLDAVRRIEIELKEADRKNDKDKDDTALKEVRGSIVLLRPKLAYAAGRDKDKKINMLMNVLDPAIKSVAENEKDFPKLLRLIEGIVAYHRFYGGTN